MEGLIVVHPELMDFENEFDQYSRLLFDKIAYEMGVSLDRRDKVYYLPLERDNSQRDVTYPAIAELMPQVVDIPCNSVVELQFLRTKELVINDHLDSVRVCGVSIDSCVADMYHLLLGEDGPDTSKSVYEEDSNDLGWSKDKFERIYSKRLNATIDYNLSG